VRLLASIVERLKREGKG